jgi:hypothetical protein
MERDPLEDPNAEVPRGHLSGCVTDRTQAAVAALHRGIVEF